MFADTAGWGNYFVRTEPFHQRAKELVKHWHGSGIRLVTTNYVLLELAALFTSPLRISRKRLIETIDTIKSTSWIEIVHIDSTLNEEAWTLLREREDKKWRLVDCASFVVMQPRNILEALTSDPHFDQAGYVNLLK